MSQPRYVWTCYAPEFMVACVPYDPHDYGCHWMLPSTYKWERKGEPEGITIFRKEGS